MTNRTDDFNRANSAVSLGTPSDAGSAWVPLGLLVAGIDTNTAYSVTSISQAIAYLESSVADVTIQSTTPTKGTDCGLCARVTDNNNYIVAIQAPTSWLMYKRVGGAFTQLGSTASGTPANGDVLKVTLNSNALEFFVNGTSKITATESFNNTATKHGLRWSSDTTARFDDFSIIGASGGTTYTITPSGGATFAGSGIGSKGKVILPTGGVALGGSGNSLKSKSILPSGGVAFSGSAPQVRGKILSISGGIVFSGNGNAQFIPAGGVTIVPQRNVVGSGV